MFKSKPAKKGKREVEGDAAEQAADRPAYKRGGSVKSGKGATVNIVIAGQGSPDGTSAPPPGAMMAGGPPIVAGPPPGAGVMAVPPPGPPMGPPPAMARGGRMTAGAGSGLGRLQKL